MEADRRGFAWFPPAGTAAADRQVFEDDSESLQQDRGGHGFWSFTLGSRAEALAVGISRTGPAPERFDELDLELPGREIRPLEVTGGRLEADKNDGLRRMIRIRLN